MLVYGDHPRVEDPRAVLARIDGALQRLTALPPGIERHAELVAIFIEAGELMQGIADASFHARGCDEGSPDQASVMTLLMQLAHAVRRSWKSGFEALLTAVVAPELSHLDFPDAIEIKRPEGYGFYALYPESYLEAAESVSPEPAVKVIGIRSIGTGLAALVAAALDADAPATLRPCGHPFRRALALAPDLSRDLLAHQGAFAIADEGPGLSGSSFGAVADFLEGGGVPPERIHVFPSHAGELGPKASPRHRERWERIARHCVEFEPLALETPMPAHQLSSWVTDLVGALERPLEDISGGAWRQHRCGHEAEWPAANVQQERRKFLAHTETGTWLLKFAGLGREGAAKLDRARQLHAAGFTPEPRGFRHGFLVEGWLGPARPLDPARCDRARLVDTVGSYLGFRARAFPAAPDRGASLDSLIAMARHNAAHALGATAAADVEEFASQAGRLEQRVRRIETDNRMHRWEWLALTDGRVVKTDALDHNNSHDLVGCQDVAWDVAGATVELDLSPAERDRLCSIVEREAGHGVDPELLRVLTPCYLAFQLGASALAAQALVGWPEEAARLERSSNRYADALRRALSPHL